MHPAIIIGIFRSLIVDVAMGQIPRSTERISSLLVMIFNTLIMFVFHCERDNTVLNFSVNTCLQISYRRYLAMNKSEVLS